jgi:hypothetical protein
MPPVPAQTKQTDKQTNQQTRKLRLDLNLEAVDAAAEELQFSIWEDRRDRRLDLKLGPVALLPVLR